MESGVWLLGRVTGHVITLTRLAHPLSTAYLTGGYDDGSINRTQPKVGGGREVVGKFPGVPFHSQGRKESLVAVI